MRSPDPRSHANATSTGPGLVRAGKDHGREPESCKILGKRCPRIKESQNKPPSIRHARVGQLAGQKQSLQAEVTEMKRRKRGRRVRRTRFRLKFRRESRSYGRSRKGSKNSNLQDTRQRADLHFLGGFGKNLEVCKRDCCPPRPDTLQRRAARRVGKMRTIWPRHRKTNRVAPDTAGRVGEASHSGLLSTKHLPYQHRPFRGCLTEVLYGNRFQRFHASPHPSLE